MTLIVNMNTRVNSHFVGASLTEFLSVWSLGGEADLSLTTKDGSLKMSFNLSLGNPGAPFPLPHAPPPSAPPPFHPPSKPRYRGPAAKERNRQRAARHQAARTEVPVSTTAPEVTNTTAAVMSSPSTSSATDSVEVSPVTAPVFKCDVCEFKTTTEKGVKTHKGHKHKEQLRDGEGNISLELSILNQVREEESDSSPLANSTLLSELEEVHISLQCDECDWKCENEINLNEHKTNVHSDMVSLEIDEHGNIVGPQLPPNSSPPSKVFHPIAGIGYLQPELSVSCGDTFVSYNFPDDPKAFVWNGKKESYWDVFLCET